MKIKNNLLLDPNDSNNYNNLLLLEETLFDLKSAGCDILTIGQYIQPSKKHLEVEKFYEEDGVPTVLSVLQLDYFKNSVQSALDSKLVDVYEKALRAQQTATSDELWEQYKELGKKHT